MSGTVPFMAREDRHPLIFRRLVGPEDLGGRWGIDFEFLLPLEVVECQCGWQAHRCIDERSSGALRAAADHLTWVADGVDGRGIVGRMQESPA